MYNFKYYSSSLKRKITAELGTIEKDEKDIIKKNKEIEDNFIKNCLNND